MVAQAFLDEWIVVSLKRELGSTHFLALRRKLGDVAATPFPRIANKNIGNP